MVRGRRKYYVRVLKVRHYGDYLTDLTNSVRRDVVISYLSLINGHSHMTLQLFPSSSRAIGEAVELAHSYKDVKSTKVLRGPGLQPFVFMVKRNYGVLRALSDTRSLKVGPVIVSRGVKYFYVLVPKGVEGRLVELVRAYSPVDAEVSISRPSNVRLVELPLIRSTPARPYPELTECELRVLREAYRAGYFRWPRAVDLERLAGRLGLSKATVLEHIRKAERKILKHYLSYYGC